MEISNNSEKQKSKSGKRGIIVTFCSVTLVCLIIVTLVFALDLFNHSANIQGRFVDIAACENQSNSQVKCIAINNKNELIMWNDNVGEKTQKLLSDINSIKLFPETNMAIKKDNSLWVWENNQYEQIGNLKTSEVPQKLLDSVKSVDRYWTTEDGANYWVKDNDNNYWQWGDKKEFNKLNNKELSKTIIQDGDVQGKIHLYLYADNHLEGEFYDEKSKSNVKETIFNNIDDIENGVDKGMILAQDGTLYMVDGGITSLHYPVASKCKYIIEICKNVKGAYFDEWNTFGIVLTNNGELYSWGEKQSGCLGNKTESDYSLQLIMKSVEDFGTSDFSNIGTETKLAITSGIIIEHQYILARKSDGTLYGFGNNKNQQIGTGNKNEIINTPTKIMDNVKKCVSCNGFNFALTNDGNIWKWGYSSNKTPKKITK